MPFYTYILESETSGRLYIGETKDLMDRLKRHNNNENKSTKGRGPWKLLHSKEFRTRSEAKSLEMKLKSWKSPKAVREWIEKDKTADKCSGTSEQSG